MRIDHWDVARDGALTEQAFRRKLEAQGYRVFRYVYPPGTVFDFHVHGHDKIDGVLSGRFRMTTDEGSVVLEAGDALYLPAGTRHRAEVVGEAPVVSLDAEKC